MILRLVENVPEKWEKRRFQEVAKIGNGQVDPTEKTYEDWLYLGPENVSSNNGKISTLKSVRQLGLISGKYFFDENSIVYAKINPYLNKVCIPGFQGLCSADMYPIWKKGKIDKRYLHQYMLSSLFLRQSISVSTRTGMPKINRNDLNKIWILVPPLSEQEKIAEILGRWDRAMELVSEKIDAKEQLKTGLMQQLLTGKVRFQGFGEDWKEISLGQFLKMKLRKVEKPGTAYLRLGVRSHGKGTFITIVDDPSKVNMTHLYQVR